MPIFKIAGKAVLILFIIATNFTCALAHQLRVGNENQFSSVTDAALKAKPGDTILITSGIYTTEERIQNLKGTGTSWITIMAEVQGEVIFRTFTQAFHFTDPEYIILEGLIFENQTLNGVNIDDGGSYSTPAHHIRIKSCEWRKMSATGNNDELKLSGLEDFEIIDCIFMNGAHGGSLIDMVGCHRGIIKGNIFRNGGSNSIQAKGGTSNLIITNNRFLDGGERAINIGGSTGLQFFRPMGAEYEASEIKVWANIFNGGTSSVAFVGSSHCEVVNNTIINPVKWVMRILQENRNQAMKPCSNNLICNNLIVFNGPAFSAVNIGPETDPGTFTIMNNLWYNPEDKNWNGPELPVSEKGQVINKDPMFADDDFRLKLESPATGRGSPVKQPEFDFFGKKFNSARAIGAIEYKPQ